MENTRIAANYNRDFILVVKFKRLYEDYFYEKLMIEKC